MASIYKPTRINPASRERVKCRHWRIAYINEHGQRVTVKGFKDKAATEAKAKNLERRVERIKAGLPVELNEKVAQPIEAAIADFLANLARQGSGVSSFHYTETERILKAIRDGTGWQTIRDIKPDEFTAYLSKMAAKGRAPRTQNRHHETLRNFLNWCVTQGWLEASPIRYLTMTPVGAKGKRHRRRAFTIDEWNRLMAVAGHWRSVYAVAALSGLRRQEIERIEKQDVKPMRWTLRADITKNGKAENLPMLSECWEAIQPIWDQAKTPTTKLFPKTPCMETVHAHMERAGIERKNAEGRVLDFHSLRYFFCTLLARKMLPQDVSRLMRHNDIRLTFNLYADLGLDHLASETITIPRVLDGAKNENEKGDTNEKQSP